MITLYIGDSVSEFNPATGKHESVESEKIKVPCYASFMSKGKQFQEYGTRDQEIMIVRFNNIVPKFDKAELNGLYYRLLEETQANKKRAYRLQRVAE